MQKYIFSGKCLADIYMALKAKVCICFDQLCTQDNFAVGENRNFKWSEAANDFIFLKQCSKAIESDLAVTKAGFRFNFRADAKSKS